MTQESILSFLLEHEGKVRNSELLNNFKSHINGSDPAEKQHNRDLFKKLVNSVAVVRQIDEVKFVVVKKRYQDFVKGGPHDASQKTQADDSFSSQNTSFSYISPLRPAKMLYSDVENNNVCYPSHMNSNSYSDVGSMQKGLALQRNVSSVDTTVKVLNISGEQMSRAGKSGAVFAVIAVKSPPRVSAAVTQDGLQKIHKPPEKPVKLDYNPSTPSNVSSYIPACKEAATSDPQFWKNGERDEIQPPSFPQGRPQNKTTRQGEDATESLPLEPLAHEWLVKCAAGLWGHIYALLLQDTRLAQKKDFMSGFTALHWAAKAGNSEMIHKLMDISRERGAYIDINSKAHGGYTPLHIAAIHGHTEVIRSLLVGYGANVNERDNDGKKAYHYLGESVSEEVRALLGGLQHNKYIERREEDDYREQSRGFNTISKLFQPHMGRKQKHSTRFAHDL